MQVLYWALHCTGLINKFLVNTQNRGIYFLYITVLLTSISICKTNNTSKDLKNIAKTEPLIPFGHAYVSLKKSMVEFLRQMEFTTNSGTRTLTIAPKRLFFPKIAYEMAILAILNGLPWSIRALVT